MKKVKILFASALFVAAAAGAFASSKQVFADFIIFEDDNPANTPQTVQSDLSCPATGFGCKITLSGTEYQLWVPDATQPSGYRPVKP